jgi:hypothetical protein
MTRLQQRRQLAAARPKGTSRDQGSSRQTCQGQGRWQSGPCGFVDFETVRWKFSGMKRRTKSRASVGGRKGGKANRVSGVSPGRARATGGGSDEMDQATYPDSALLV